MKNELDRKLVKPMNAFDLLGGLNDQSASNDKEEYDFYSMLGDISIALVNYRVEHGITQGQLAEKLCVSQAMVSKYEGGDYNFSLQTLNHICHSLDLKMCLAIKKRENWQVGYETRENGDDSGSGLECKMPDSELESAYASLNVLGDSDFPINDETGIG